MTQATTGKTAKKQTAFTIESELRRRGYAYLGGVDEVGRGPLAGPVVAAAVVLGPYWDDPGVADSKKLSPRRRVELDPIIRRTARAWSLGACGPEEIDHLNIHQASLLAMRRAVDKLTHRPDYLLVDGRFNLDMEIRQRAVIKGDCLCRSVAAASIVAKVERDAIMKKWHQRYPAYNFAANKGYATAEHRRALSIHGPCPIHRKSFAPVAQGSLPWNEENVSLGKEAEHLARSYLESLGLKVVGGNLRTRGGELDLVAWDGETLVFVEVKGRSQTAFGRPEEAVNLRKRNRLVKAAEAYLAAQAGNPAPSCRFDVLAVDFSGPSPQLVHMRDAFRAGD